MTVFLFPGQGSQAAGMGASLFALFPEIIEQADEILDFSIVDLCSGNDARLHQTAFTQPALYTVNTLHWLQQRAERGAEPDYVAGHSLGEYNALLAAGVFDFATGLRLVKKRGELMGQASGGGMAAVIGLSPEKIQQIVAHDLPAQIDIANYNSLSQTVISGPAAAIAASQSVFENAGAKYFVLKVSGAFHSRWMQPAQAEFAAFARQFVFSAPEIPVIANVTGEPLLAGGAMDSLVSQIASPVLWTKTIAWLQAQGETEFVEVGPGSVLMGLLRKIRQGK